MALDRCVKCGMCLPECPTYRLDNDENRSPRGRLALMEGLHLGRLSASSHVLQHLDTCLGCRRCERVCPSGVEFGRLMDDVRADFSSLARTLPARLLAQPLLQRLACAAGRRIPLRLSRPFRRLHAAHRVARALPVTPSVAGAQADAGGIPGDYRVGLFAGCSGHALQPSVIAAAELLLRRLGYRVVHPSRDTCCGALAAHAGDRPGAVAAERRTRAAFAGEVDTIVSIASGCGIHLDQYWPRLPHQDLLHFLVSDGRLVQTTFEPMPRRVALHTPCSVENVYRGGDWARSALDLIPSLEVVAIGAAGQCCGAAGDYMLRHPRTASRLRAPLLNELADSGADCLVSGNVGCAAHLAAGLRELGRPVEILHPVELLARQLPTRR